MTRYFHWLFPALLCLSGLSGCGRRASEIEHIKFEGESSQPHASDVLPQCAATENLYYTSESTALCIPTPLVKPLQGWGSPTNYLSLADTERCQVIEKVLAAYATTYLKTTTFTFGSCKFENNALSHVVWFLLNGQPFGMKVVTKAQKVSAQICEVQKEGTGYSIIEERCDKIYPKIVPQTIVDIYPKPHKNIVNLFSTVLDTLSK